MSDDESDHGIVEGNGANLMQSPKPQTSLRIKEN